MKLDPLKTTFSIVGRYEDYLTTTFSLEEDLRKQLYQKLKKPGKFSKGPILEATPPFKEGCALKELIKEGVLSREFEKIEDKFPERLYIHQEKGIRKSIEGRNIVVATGTGSGKTEVFLIPILNYLMRQKEKGALGPGVRALLLYPMNALANDQLKRLRGILKGYPEITFGTYTGETKNTPKEAREHFFKIHGGDNPLLENEIISREEMQLKPPNILLTNYAMLEYLLLRPKDNVFFDGEHAKDWKFIVLDEAHSYSGTKGMEIAMLIRRLKERVIRSRKGELRCFATSATLGGGKGDFKEVVSFAENLFNEEFSWEPKVLGKQDVIVAERKNLTEGKAWGKPKTQMYLEMQEYLDEKRKHFSELITIAEKNEVPLDVLKKSKTGYPGNPEGFLHSILSGDERLISLQKTLEKGPAFLELISEEIFPHDENKRELLVALVFLANKAKLKENTNPLLPARYHLFIRAAEGAYISFLPKIELFLEKREKTEEDFPVFEIAACNRCQALYLTGKKKDQDGRLTLLQGSKKITEEIEPKEFFLVLDRKQYLTEENEDEDLWVDIYQKGSGYDLCPGCSSLDSTGQLSSCCICEKKPKKIRLLEVKAKENLIHKCPACGTSNPKGSVVFGFNLGAEAVTSVLATALYQELPEIEENKMEKPKKENDEWASFLDKIEKEEGKTKKRRLLIFSDSRQDAAFFSTYLGTTYSQILRRRLLLETLLLNKERVLKNNWRVNDLFSFAKKFLLDTQFFPAKSPQEIEDLVWKWILYEFLTIDRKNSIESLGILGFSLVKPPKWFGLPPLQKHKVSLNPDEAWILVQFLFDSIRRNNGIQFPDSIDPKDEYFSPNNREVFLKKKSGGNKRVIGWSPAGQGYSNSRLDYFVRILEKSGIGEPKKEAHFFLDNLWDVFLKMFKDYIEQTNEKGLGVVYRVKLDRWELLPGIIDKRINWFKCDVCNRITFLNLRGICPTYKCQGTLALCDPEEEMKKNHYRKIYSEINPIPMETSEHTAQLKTEKAAEIQEKFYEGEINVLSCSTTFELGVDVGSLESIFMRNVPPTAASYIQRAGRAGRRTDTAAFALTYAQRRSHDFSHFNEPLRVVSGEITPPHFRIENEKIIVRHLNAEALSRFWKREEEFYGDVNKFFFKGQVPGPKALKNYMEERDPDLKAALLRIVDSKKMREKLEIENWGWIDNLFDDKFGVLNLTEQELSADIRALEEIIQDHISNKKYGAAGRVSKTKNTILSKNLIGFLAQRNVLPKYGFPVDVVTLQIEHWGEEGKGLQLDRDLKVALSEYAPESQVIAGGKLWKSRYIKKLPQREPLKYDFAKCEQCGFFCKELSEKNKDLSKCSSCGNEITKWKGTYIQPEFGFISEKPQRPTMNKPQKTFTTRKFYSGRPSTEITRNIKWESLEIKIHSASNADLTVINHAGLRGFAICSSCGYSELWKKDLTKKHQKPNGKDCKGSFKRYSLGYNFQTDVLEVEFPQIFLIQDGFWESILYGLLEGASSFLGIERDDIDGCLFFSKGAGCPSLIFFDDVPGGAGHVKRMIEGESMTGIIERTLKIMGNCDCGGQAGDASCYSCIQNYTNQFCHDVIKRSYILDFFQKEVFLEEKP